MRNQGLPFTRGLWSAHSSSGKHGDDQSLGLPPAISGHGRGVVWGGLPRLGVVVQAGRFAQRDSGLVSCRWQQSSRSWSAYGSDLGAFGRSEHHDRLRFDRPLPSGGYAWWYIDALSDDGKCGVTLIAFLGSVFSPYYAWARRGGAADPLNHCAFNIALYGPRSGRWAMTERGAAQVSREETLLAIGPSYMCWDGAALTIAVDERCAPLPRPLRGMIRLWPAALEYRSYPLDRSGLHRWVPYAPCARIEVAFAEPQISWRGAGYFDANFGV